MAELHKASDIKIVELATRYDGYLPLRTIEAPTLVLVRVDDTLTPPSEAARIADGIGGATMAVMPEAGHSSNTSSRPASTKSCSISCSPTG